MLLLIVILFTFKTFINQLLDIE